MGPAVTLGVMGGAGDVPTADQLGRAHTLGRAAAEAGCVVITGACPGLPLAAACGAKQAGGRRTVQRRRPSPDARGEPSLTMRIAMGQS